MKINLTDLTEKIEKQDYIQDLQTVKYGDVSQSKTKLKKYAAKMVQEVAAAFKHNSLVQTQLAISGQRPVTFALETNIINLPYADYKKISNFFEEGEDYQLQVYFETRSDYVNVSHFRIDELCSEEDIEKKADEITEKLTTAMQEKLKVVRSYKKPAAKKKKATRRRTTRKRSTTKRKTTRKRRTTKK